MQQPDIDKLLTRRLYLQRYVTSLVNDVADLTAAGDKELITLLSEFIADADDKTLTALSQQRTSNADAAAVLSGIRAIVSSQRDLTQDLLSDQMGQLIEHEVALTSSAMHATAPATRGIATLPVSGQSQSAIMTAAFTLYATRLLADITQAAVTGPGGVIQIIRGTRNQGYSDGVFSWRDNRLIRPNIDMIVNGNAANAASHVYAASRVEMVDHLATLDFRTCARCFTAESNGPYRLGSQPAIPVHPRCRCLSVPHISGLDTERPFVKDDRSVKNIPLDERGGKIGTTRDSIEQFFGRMTEAQRIDYMGPSRAALWRRGEITDIKQLVNQRTLKPLRLDQLPK